MRSIIRFLDNRFVIFYKGPAYIKSVILIFRLIILSSSAQVSYTVLIEAEYTESDCRHSGISNLDAS